MNLGHKTGGSYLEDYLESVSHLPAEIKRNFGLMRELDEVFEKQNFEAIITSIVV